MLACKPLSEFIPIHPCFLHYLMKPAFPEISKIAYEGPTSKNPLAFKHDSAKVIENRILAYLPEYFE
jgi:hypothetical protein